MTCASSAGTSAAAVFARACSALPAPGIATVTDRLIHENPAQRELGHRRVAADEPAHPFDRRQADLVGHSGKRLADVECFAVTIELTVIARIEDGIGAKFSG